MKVYCFYTNTVTGLTPQLYAFTHKKTVSEKFADVRKGLRCIIKHMPRTEYNDMRDRLGSLYIIPEELVSQDTNGNKTKIHIYATENEVIDFRAHMDAIITVRLGMHAINTDIFEDDVKDALDSIGMKGCYESCIDPMTMYDPGATGSIRYEEVYQPKLWTDKYTIDEFELFLQHRWYTFFNNPSKL